MEQATHFVDLMRYLSGGDIIQESIQAVAVGPDMALKEMPAHPQAEHLVRPASYLYAMTHALLPDTCTSCMLLCGYADMCIAAMHRILVIALFASMQAGSQVRQPV